MRRIGVPFCQDAVEDFRGMDFCAVCRSVVYAPGRIVIDIDLIERIQGF
jgi:hypothetical protein